MVESEIHSTQSVETVAKLNEDVEFIRIGCNKLAKENRDSSERLGSLEKLIANSNTEVNYKIGTLEKQLATMSDTVSRLEARFCSNQSKDTGVAITSDSLHQVRTSVLEPVQNGDLLGYRRITSVLKNQDGLLKKNEMPVFSGFFPFDWICRVERFFSFGRYTDMEKLECVSLGLEGSVLHWFNGEMEKAPFSNWSHFTDRLLDRFSGSFDDEPASEISTVAALRCSSQEVFLKHVSTPETVQGAISNCAPYIIDIEMNLEEEKQKKEMAPTTDPVKEVYNLSLDMQNEVVLSKDSSQEEEFTKKMTLMQKIESRDRLQSGLVLDGLHTELHTEFGSDDLCVHQRAELYMFQVKKEDELTLKSPCVQTKLSAYEVFDVWPLKTEKKSMKMEKEKLPKSWRFKYKYIQRWRSTSKQRQRKTTKWSKSWRFKFKSKLTEIIIVQEAHSTCAKESIWLELPHSQKVDSFWATKPYVARNNLTKLMQSDEVMTETNAGQDHEMQKTTVSIHNNFKSFETAVSFSHMMLGLDYKGKLLRIQRLMSRLHQNIDGEGNKYISYCHSIHLRSMQTENCTSLLWKTCWCDDHASSVERNIVNSLIIKVIEVTRSVEISQVLGIMKKCSYTYQMGVILFIQQDRLSNRKQQTWSNLGSFKFRGRVATDDWTGYVIVMMQRRVLLLSERQFVGLVTVLKTGVLLLFPVQNRGDYTPYIRMTQAVSMRDNIVFTVDSLVILKLMEEQCKKQQSTIKSWMFKYRGASNVLVSTGQQVLQTEKFLKPWRFKYKATRKHVQFLLSTSGVDRKSSSTWHRWRLKNYNTSAWNGSTIEVAQ